MLKRILPGLELLEEIQITGDIFFPARWLKPHLADITRRRRQLSSGFLAQRPDYNASCG